MATGFTDLLPAIAALADPNRRVTLAEVADLAGLSPSRAQRVLSAVLGESPKAMDRRIRLDLAAMLLASADERVIDVALSVGFDSHEGFTRAFVDRFGEPPSTWRSKRQRWTAEQAALAMSASRCARLHHRSVDPPKRKDPPMTYEIAIETLETVPTLYQERQVDRDQVGESLAEILPAVFAYLMGEGLAPAGHPFVRHVGMTAAFLTLQAGIPLAVAPATPPPTGSGFSVGELPAGPAAVTVHRGPYEGLGDAHAAVDRWVAASEYRAQGGPWELYLTDPGEVPDPADWLTKICLPLA